jgi:curved DNA-binding protein CbpA
MTKDYYAILGVPRAADGATIHSAFRARARQYHPDAGAGSSAPKFSEALEAYHTLSDPQLRRQHDIDLGAPTRQSNIIPEPLFAPERSWPDYRYSRAYHLDTVRELFELIESDLDFSIRVSRTFF